MCQIGIVKDTTCSRLEYLRINYVCQVGIFKGTTCARLGYLRVLRGHVPGWDI
jgi:hypothetical protein